MFFARKVSVRKVASIQLAKLKTMKENLIIGVPVSLNQGLERSSAQ